MTDAVRLCPACEVELEEDYGACADYDFDCDCDQGYKCPDCHKRIIVNCPAHAEVEWLLP